VLGTLLLGFMNFPRDICLALSNFYFQLVPTVPEKALPNGRAESEIKNGYTLALFASIFDMLAIYTFEK
jgi:hypothetical protein